MRWLRTVHATSALLVCALTVTPLFCTILAHAANTKTCRLVKSKSETPKLTESVRRYAEERFTDFSGRVSKWWQSNVRKLRRTDAGQKVLDGISEATRRAESITRKFNTGEAPGGNQAVVHLTNGSTISCQILAEDERHILVFWEGGEVTFSRDEILKIEKNREIFEGDGIRVASENTDATSWPYAQNPVVQLTNGQVLDAKVVRVDGDVVFLKESLGTGAIDHEIKRNRIEALAFKPVRHSKSDAIGKKLKAEFPKMKVYEDGIVTLITDSEGASLKALRRAIAETFVAVYLDFFDLLGSREPGWQNYVVVFDKIEDYFAYAAADGVPPWMCPGYFVPERKTLYVMNYFGDSFSKIIYDTISMARISINETGDALKRQYGDQYSAQIDGAVQQVKVMVENWTAYVKGILSDRTLKTMRHEVTHEMLHAWGVQSILVSKSEKKLRRTAEPSAGDLESKKKLIMQAMGLDKDADEPQQMEAANSWFVEGVAEYAATSALGRPNTRRLFVIKDARAQNQLLPLEHLTVYKMGSFPGIADKAMLSAYAQSWSLVEYLMKDHRRGFVKYLERMATEQPTRDDDLRWLLEATGQELRALENGWHAHIDALPPAEDPEIEEWIRVREIFGIQ